MLMKRTTLLWMSLYGLVGCHAEVTPKQPAEYPMTFVQVPRFDKVGEQPVPEGVTSPMPDPLYERPPVCPQCTIAVPGRWLWQAQWVWSHGYCEAGRRDNMRTRFLCTDSELVCTGAATPAHPDGDARHCELRYIPEQYRQAPGPAGQVGTFRQAYWGMIQTATPQE